MLILTRKINQKIRIGNDIILNIISISENNVKIGIEADKSVQIFREEVYEAIKEHTKKATELNKLPDDVKLFKLNKINKKNEKK